MIIDEANKVIYVDYSMLSAFKKCKELERLGYERGYQPKVRRAALDFGHAFHAAIAAYYNALAGWHFDTASGEWTELSLGASPTRCAQAAFLRDCKIEGATLPVSLESEERRSIERGLALVEAYIYRWRNEQYENILDAVGRPYTELGFEFPLTIFDGYTIVHVGRIDRLMRSMTTDRPVVFEIKTTTQGLDNFIKQCKPNHQITTYFNYVKDIMPDVRECVWDCTFLSDRKPDMAKALTDRFWMYGIDTSKDFKRQITSRSSADVTEFIRDAEADALDYVRWATSNAQRWPRTAPGACHTYGGCQFRDRCSLNMTPLEEESYMMTFFDVKAWEPHRRIVGNG